MTYAWVIVILITFCNARITRYSCQPSQLRRNDFFQNLSHELSTFCKNCCAFWFFRILNGRSLAYVLSPVNSINTYTYPIIFPVPFHHSSWHHSLFAHSSSCFQIIFTCNLHLISWLGVWSSLTCDRMSERPCTWLWYDII